VRSSVGQARLLEAAGPPVDNIPYLLRYQGWRPVSIDKVAIWATADDGYVPYSDDAMWCRLGASRTTVSNCENSEPQMSGMQQRSWREMMSDWMMWVSIAVCLVVATIAWLLGYD
jgi:hypothetical protein